MSADTTLPLVDGTTFDPDLADLAQWASAYPAVNVEQELRKMRAWLDANPKNRKTKSGIKRFVNAWLTKAQDRGGASPLSAGRPQSEVRARSVNADLVDVSWVTGHERQRAAAVYFIEKHGCFFFDGKFHNTVQGVL